ncbi:MAG: flagellar hook-associated protein FlgL [Enterobacteriaceae bacterium]
MRITTLNMSSMMLNKHRQNVSSMSRLFEQMQTGKKILRPSDDPVSATRIIQLNREKSRLEQYQQNIDRIAGSLTSQETHVKSVDDALQKVNEKLLAAVNDSASQEDMQGYGQELASLVQTLVGEMNSKNVDGQYLFGGTKDNQAPVIYDEAQGKYIFQGNHDQRESTIGNGVDIPSNTDLSTVFSEGGGDMALLNKLNDLSKKMQDPTIDRATYVDEMREVTDSVQRAIGKNAAVLGDLGGRQNQLELMKDTHEGVKIANEWILQDLSQANPVEVKTRLGMMMDSMQLTLGIYKKITELSLY